MKDLLISALVLVSFALSQFLGVRSPSIGLGLFCFAFAVAYLLGVKSVALRALFLVLALFVFARAVSNSGNDRLFLCKDVMEVTTHAEELIVAGDAVGTRRLLTDFNKRFPSVEWDRDQRYALVQELVRESGK